MSDLATVYSRIETATSPCQIFGITDSRDFRTVKAAYRALVLVIHPDKCRPDQAELHTRLFVKVHAAYETLQSRRGESQESPNRAPSPVEREEQKASEPQEEVPEDDFFDHWGTFWEEHG